jgi:hypothetical protein
MSGAGLVAGFCLALVGVYLIAGAGWACLTGGLVLFVSSGLAARGEARGRR